MSEKYTTTDGHLWKSIWIVPAAIAAVVFLIYALLFKEEKKIPITGLQAETGLATSPIT